MQSRNPLHLHFNLANTKARVRYWKARLDGTYPGDNIKTFLHEFIDRVRMEVLFQYITTYSHKEYNIKRRTFYLERQLNFSRVYQTSRFGWSADATKTSLHPLGAGDPFYAIFQETGTVHGIQARDFILAGDRYINENFDRELANKLREWGGTR